ncbi:MAG: hypothetical protein GXY38_13935 [Planctomycetes bacterium]|nr:hypothetical protein [Planctomycetota bacterium]
MMPRWPNSRDFDKHESRPDFSIAATPSLAAMPLLYGMQRNTRVGLDLRPPDVVSSLLDDGLVDAALIPSFELQRQEKYLTVLGAGCLSCAGTSLAARIYSHVPAKQLRTILVDADARTASAMAQVIWECEFGHKLEVTPYDRNMHEPSAMQEEGVLVIENEVVARPPLGFDWQLDLCALWNHMTGLPFVFAVWAAPPGGDMAAIFSLLEGARLAGQAHLQQIAHRSAPHIEWPEDLAERFLAKHMQYEFGEAQREGLEEFFHLCESFGLTHEFRPVQYFRP